MTEGTFILYTTKRNRIRSHLPAIDRLNRSLPKETKEGTRLHKGSQYIVPGLCTPGYRQGPKTSTGMHRGPGWRCSQQQPAHFPKMLLTRHVTILSHNRLFPSTGSQVTSHIMQQEGMTRNFLFRQQTVTLKKTTKKPHAAPHPLSFPREQPYGAAVQSLSSLASTRKHRDYKYY